MEEVQMRTTISNEGHCLLTLFCCDSRHISLNVLCCHQLMQSYYPNHGTLRGSWICEIVTARINSLICYIDCGGYKAETQWDI